MRILDIHTHKLPEVAGTALVCIGCGPLPEREGHFFSAGLHPWDVTGHDDEAFHNLEKLLELPQLLAVGECGFDTLKGPSHELQEQAFIRQVELSERFKKPMLLHVVRDFDTVIRLRKQLKPSQRWMIHGFRGNSEQMDQLHKNGLQISLGPKSNTETLKQIPSDRLFLETDTNCPIQEVIQKAALVRGQTPESIITYIIRNHHSFLLQ